MGMYEVLWGAVATENYGRRPYRAWCKLCRTDLPSGYEYIDTAELGLARHAAKVHGAILCSTCKGDGHYPDRRRDAPCPTCMGSGTTTPLELRDIPVTAEQLAEIDEPA